MLVISLGGSLINKNKINTPLLKNLRTFLKNKSFVVITGGGRVARQYQQALAEFKNKSTDLDLMGITATKLNAFFVSKVLKADLMSFDDFVSSYNKLKNKRKIRVVSFGIKPGFTTDYVSVKFADFLGEKTVINMSRIRFVRVKDKPVKHLSWKDYLRLIPKHHIPGLRIPFDVEASKFARRSKIRVIFAKDTNDLKLFVDKGLIMGTVINFYGANKLIIPSEIKKVR